MMTCVCTLHCTDNSFLIIYINIYIFAGTPNHRFIVPKKKRSLSAREIRNAISDLQMSDSIKPYYVSGFDSRYNPSEHF